MSVPEPIAEVLAAALRRCEPYCDRLPPTAAVDVRAALELWEAHVKSEKEQ